MKARRRQAGFTLIEVMIALLIMALVSVLAWRGLDIVTRSSERINENTEATAAIMRVLKQFEKDVQWRAGTEIQVLPGVEVDPRQRRVSLMPAGMMAERPNRGNLRIVMIRRVAGQPGYWQAVQWWRDGDTLYRSEGPARSEFPIPPDPAGVAVLGNVVDFDLRAWEPGAGWARQPSLARQNAATGLELLVTQRAAQGNVVYRRVVLVR